jgi:hypothetical protein
VLVYLTRQTRGRKGRLRWTSGCWVYKLLSQSSRQYVRGRYMFALVRLRVDRYLSLAYDLRRLYGISEVCLPVTSVSFAPHSRIHSDQCLPQYFMLDSMFARVSFLSSIGKGLRRASALPVSVRSPKRCAQSCCTSFERSASIWEFTGEVGAYFLGSRCR